MCRFIKQRILFSPHRFQHYGNDGTKIKIKQRREKKKRSAGEQQFVNSDAQFDFNVIIDILYSKSVKLLRVIYIMDSDIRSNTKFIRCISITFRPIQIAWMQMCRKWISIHLFVAIPQSELRALLTISLLQHPFKWCEEVGM